LEMNNYMFLPLCSFGAFIVFCFIQIAYILSTIPSNVEICFIASALFHLFKKLQPVLYLKDDFGDYIHMITNLISKAFKQVLRTWSAGPRTSWAWKPWEIIPSEVSTHDEVLQHSNLSWQCPYLLRK
jgi:hypothetical protein